MVISLDENNRFSCAFLIFFFFLIFFKIISGLDSKTVDINALIKWNNIPTFPEANDILRGMSINNSKFNGYMI